MLEFFKVSKKDPSRNQVYISKYKQNQPLVLLAKFQNFLKSFNFAFGRFFLVQWRNLEKNRLESQPNLKITEFLNFSKTSNCSVAIISKIIQFWTKLQLEKLYIFSLSTKFLFTKIEVQFKFREKNGTEYQQHTNL